MKGKLTIIAMIQAKKEKAAMVEKEVLKLLEPTRKEEGCLEYKLYRDNDHSESFLFHETWENRDLWQAHMNNEPLQNFIKVTEGSLEDLTVKEMSLLEE